MLTEDGRKLNRPFWVNSLRPVSHLIGLQGQVFQNRKVLYRAPDTKHGAIRYTVKCLGCDKVSVTSASAMVTKKTGCISCQQRDRNTNWSRFALGARFGSREVLSQPSREPDLNKATVQVRCACGYVSWVNCRSLLSGRSGRCGACDGQRRRAEDSKALGDLTGQRIGTRVVDGPAEKDCPKGRRNWRWICDCGNTGVAQSTSLHMSGTCPKCAYAARDRRIAERKRACS